MQGQHVPRDDALLRNLFGGGTARAEHAQGTPIQSHISPNTLVDEDNPCFRGECPIPSRS